MGKNVYTSEVKWAVVKEKLAGNSITTELWRSMALKIEKKCTY